MMQTTPQPRLPSVLVPVRFEITRNPEGAVMVSTVCRLAMPEPVEARIEGTDLLVSAAGKDRFRFAGLRSLDLEWIRAAPVLLLVQTHRGVPVACRMSLAGGNPSR